MRDLPHKILQWGYQHFAKFNAKAFLRRLPIYLLGLMILMVWGVKGLMFTFFVCLAFVAGWLGKTLKAAVADYRLTKRLERVHFTAIEYDTMKRERDMAMQAYMSIRDNKGRGAEVARPPMPPGPPRNATIDPDQIREFVAQYGGES